MATPKEAENKSVRPIDQAAEQNLGYTEKNYTAVSKKEVKTWQAFFVIAIVLGAAVSLIWAASSDMGSSSEAAIKIMPVRSSCVDSDLGSDFFVKGTTTVTASSGRKTAYTDNCLSTSSIMEYYCKGISGMSTSTKCEFGCVNGACLKAAAPTTTPTSTPMACTDGDNGRNYYQKATTTGPDAYGGSLSKIASYGDRCDGSSRLMEFYCMQGSSSTAAYVTMENISCQNGCVNGVCNQTAPTSTITCVDSDNGVNRMSLGKCTDATGTFSDACTIGPSGEPLIKEYYCSQNKCYSTDYNCRSYGYSTCSSGVCMGLPNPTSTPTTTP
jgi:hypothetical protein